MRIFTLACYSLWAFLPCLPALAGDLPTAQELVAHAPVVDSHDLRLRSADVEGYISSDAGPPLLIEFRYKSPDQFAIQLSDSNDRVPLLFASNKGAILYDPRSLTVNVLESDKLYLKVTGEDGRYYNVGLGFAGMSKGDSRLLIDFGSILGWKDSLKYSISSTSRIITLTGTSTKGNRWVCKSDVNDPFNFQSIVLELKGGGPSPFGITKLAKNVFVSDLVFIPPDLKPLTPDFSIKNWSKRELEDNIVNASDLLKVMLLRLAIYDPSLRGPFNVPGEIPIDWERLKRNDLHYVSSMRSRKVSK